MAHARSQMRKDFRNLSRERLLKWLEQHQELYAMGDLPYASAMSDGIVLLAFTFISGSISAGIDKNKILKFVEQEYDNILDIANSRNSQGSG